MGYTEDGYGIGPYGDPIEPTDPDEDVHGFQYGDVDGTTYGGLEGSRWSPIADPRPTWRIAGRSVTVTDLSLTYDSLDLSFQVPRIRIGNWREEFDTAGDIDKVVGTAGRFRQLVRSDSQLEIDIIPQTEFTPEPFETSVWVVSDYSDDPIANGERYEVDMSFGRPENVGPTGLTPPRFDGDPRTANTDSQTLLTDGGSPEYVTDDSGGTTTESETDSDGTAGTTTETPARPTSTTASITGGTVSSAEITTEENTDSSESIDPDYDISGDINPDDDDWIIQWPSEDVFVLGNRRVIPPNTSASGLESLELSLRLNSSQARVLLENPAYLDAVTDIDIPDANNIALDGADGRNTLHLTPPVGSEFHRGQYIVSDWSLEPWAVTEWQASLTLQPHPDLTRRVIEYDGFGVSQFGLDPFGL